MSGKKAVLWGEIRRVLGGFLRDTGKLLSGGKVGEKGLRRRCGAMFCSSEKGGFTEASFLVISVLYYRPRHCKATYVRFARRGMRSYGRMKRGRRTDPASRMLAPSPGSGTRGGFRITSRPLPPLFEKNPALSEK